MTPEEMQQRKRELGLTYQGISDLSGVPLPTVQRIVSGDTENPREYSLAGIEKVLSLQTVREDKALSSYMTKAQGEYTVEDDYYNLPEDERCEIIDGVIYDLGAPTWTHQQIITFIVTELRTYIKSKNGLCKAAAAPLDVKLGDKTIVQPDVLVLCDRKKNKQKRVEGAPDLAVEIFSPSSRKKDATIKHNKYAEVGVREYWTIDPDNERVIVYLLEDEYSVPRIYTFEDKVPVHIFNDDCKIDFSEIKKELAEWASPEESED